MFAPPYLDKPNFAKRRIIGTYMQDDTSCNNYHLNLTENLQLFNLFPNIYLMFALFKSARDLK